MCTNWTLILLVPWWVGSSRIACDPSFERVHFGVQDFCLCDPGNLFLFEATHLVAAGRGLAQIHMDSVWVGNEITMKLKFLWQGTDNLCLQGFAGSL